MTTANAFQGRRKIVQSGSAILWEMWA